MFYISFLFFFFTKTTGRTVLIIAHRLSTIQNANAVAVLDQRRVAECGQHTELLGNRDGLFRRLMEKQAFLQEEQQRALRWDEMRGNTAHRGMKRGRNWESRSVAGRKKKLLYLLQIGERTWTKRKQFAVIGGEHRGTLSRSPHNRWAIKGTKGD